MKISNETKIGVLTTLAITVLILCYSYLRGNDIFSTTNRYYAIYNSVEGLSVSKPVLVNGFQIGHISKMTLQPDGRTIVEFKIEPQYNIPDNTRAKLESTDLLGSKAIVFQMGNSKKFAADQDTLEADIQGSLAESLQPIQKKTEQLISKMDSSLDAINKTMNPEFQKNINRSFLSIANTLQTLEGNTKKIDTLVGSQSGHIKGILANAEATSDNLKTSTAHLNTIAGNAESFSNDLAHSNIKQTLENANKAIANLQESLAKINNGKGSMGLLLNDDHLYRNLDSASNSLNKLLVDLKAHPKRYVSFSVFGKKDK